MSFIRIAFSSRLLIANAILLANQRKQIAITNVFEKIRDNLDSA